MKRHIDYFEMVDALKADVVCPVCYLIDKSVENYIDSFLYEGVRKSDYRFSSEPWGDEKDAWIRAVYMWAGRR